MTSEGECFDEYGMYKTDPYHCRCECHFKMTGEESLRCKCCVICQYCGIRVQWGKYKQHKTQHCKGVKLV
ncbi:MAG: hypothetical protein ABH822_01860 [Patescibacteria group bacterium]